MIYSQVCQNWHWKYLPVSWLMIWHWKVDTRYFTSCSGWKLVDACRRSQNPFWDNKSHFIFNFLMCEYSLCQLSEYSTVYKWVKDVHLQVLKESWFFPRGYIGHTHIKQNCLSVCMSQDHKKKTSQSFLFCLFSFLPPGLIYIASR